MSTQDKEIPNPPAFPTIGDVSYNPTFLTEHGMTLRDYFAAKALRTFDLGNLAAYYKDYAILAYEMADAMLKERSKQN